MPAHQFPTPHPFQSRQPRPDAQNPVPRGHPYPTPPPEIIFSRNTRRAEETSASIDVYEGCSESPPSYARAASHDSAQRKDSAGETAGSFNLVEKIESQYWRITSSNGLYRWSLEIFSWMISALCMIAIIAILIATDGKRQPSWPMASIISVVSRVATSALLIPTAEALGEVKLSWFTGGGPRSMWDLETLDAATRGPMGSLLLLLRRKGGYVVNHIVKNLTKACFRTLAALGAAIMLLAVGLDPFFQQVVSFQQRQIVVGNANASLPRLQKYDTTMDVSYSYGSRVSFADQTMQPIFSGYFLNHGGVASQLLADSSASIPIACPTSNCTWPEYNSLSICSSCSDISDLLEYGCTNSSGNWRNNLMFGPGDPYDSVSSCGHYLNLTSSAPALMTGLAKDEQGRPLDAVTMRTLPLDARLSNYYNGSIRYKDLTDKLADFLVVGVDGPASDVYTGNYKVIAHECVLNWCVKNYRSSYHEGRYQEEIINTYENTEPASSPWEYVWGTLANTTRLNAWWLTNVSITPPAMDAGEFTVDNLTSLQIALNWNNFLPSSSVLANESADPWLYYAALQVSSQGPYSRRYLNNPWLPPNNITDYVGQLANALTNAIRSSSSAEVVYGTAYETQIFVKAGWLWLILPLAVLIASLVFLVVTVRKSSGSTTMWKNSAVATLMHALPEEVRERLHGTGDNPQAIAKKVTIELDPRGGNWRMSVAMAKSNAEPVLSPRLNSVRAGWF